MKNLRLFLLVTIVVLASHFGGVTGCDNSSGDPSSSGSPVSSLTVEQGRNAEEFIIPKSLHPLGKEITVVVARPSEAAFPTPAGTVVVLHGSGGLFREAGLGLDCSEILENNFEELKNYLVERGYRVILPSSMYSKAYPKFCEDNSAYIDFGPEDWDRKERRLVYRLYDLYATMRYVLEVEGVDPKHILLTGTSDGGSTIFAYSGNFFEQNLQRFYENKASELASVPLVSLPNRPLPTATVAVSPGCGVQGLYTLDTNVAVLSDDKLYSPAVPLFLEIGDQDEDKVPDHCTTGVPGYKGTRQTQAAEYTNRTGIDNYHVTILGGGKHDLLGGPFGDQIREKIVNTAQEHF